jgi:hypothetical protein
VLALRLGQRHAAIGEMLAVIELPKDGFRLHQRINRTLQSPLRQSRLASAQLCESLLTRRML